MVIYIARLPCGCVVDACPEHEDVRLWLYGCLGNGWAVERIDPSDPIEGDCPTCQEKMKPRQTSMF
jgi:hypothetical protein